MTTATYDPSQSPFRKPFVYKPEDDPSQDQTTKDLLSGAAKASLSRLQNPGGVWNPENFQKITQHLLQPINEQFKQQNDATTAFLRSRGFVDSGKYSGAMTKYLRDTQRQAAEAVYTPLLLEQMRNQDAAAQADIAQAANLGQQQRQANLQGQSQAFQQWSTGRQLEQTDQQLAVQLRGMAVQERGQLLNEVNSAVTRATQAAEATGQYVDPVTGQSYETLLAKQNQLSRAVQLMQQTGFMPEALARESGATDADIARAQGMSEEEIARRFGTGALGGVRLSDLVSPEDVAALGETAPPASPTAGGPAPAAPSTEQVSYLTWLQTVYDLNPADLGRIQSSLLGGNIADIFSFLQTATRKSPGGGTAPHPAGGTTPPPAGGTTPPPTGGTTPPSGGVTPPPAGSTTPPGGGTPAGVGPETPPPAGGTAADREFERIVNAHPSITPAEKFDLRGALDRGQFDYAKSMEESLKARETQAPSDVSVAALGRALAALGRGEGVLLADWTAMTPDQQSKVMALPNFRRQGGAQTLDYTPAPGQAPEPYNPPAGSIPTLGLRGDVGDLLGLGGVAWFMTNGQPDPAKGMSRIRQEARNRYGFNLPQATVEALYRGDIVTL